MKTDEPYKCDECRKALQLGNGGFSFDVLTDASGQELEILIARDLAKHPMHGCGSEHLIKQIHKAVSAPWVQEK